MKMKKQIVYIFILCLTVTLFVLDKKTDHNCDINLIVMEIKKTDPELTEKEILNCFFVKQNGEWHFLLDKFLDFYYEKKFASVIEIIKKNGGVAHNRSSLKRDLYKCFGDTNVSKIIEFGLSNNSNVLNKIKVAPVYKVSERVTTKQKP